MHLDSTESLERITYHLMGTEENTLWRRYVPECDINPEETDAFWLEFSQVATKSVVKILDYSFRSVA